jgi:hypothetical protein
MAKVDTTFWKKPIIGDHFEILVPSMNFRKIPSEGQGK